mmetsp:Transcript_14979/g.15097  ORF Transcript_14979/g.15097 Transcript_14979/m.15097 type:complete len:242 (-) Transcript_14979:1-726(-)
MDTADNTQDFSVIRSCIRRFRENAPAPKEKRNQVPEQAFWWLDKSTKNKESFPNISSSDSHQLLPLPNNLLDNKYPSLLNIDHVTNDQLNSISSVLSPNPSLLVPTSLHMQTNEEYNPSILLKNSNHSHSIDLTDLDNRADALLLKCDSLMESYDNKKYNLVSRPALNDSVDLSLSLTTSSLDGMLSPAIREEIGRNLSARKKIPVGVEERERESEEEIERRLTERRERHRERERERERGG